MIRIEIKNSYSKIIGLDLNLFRKLKKELSYQIPGSFFSKNPWEERYKFLIDDNLVFPSGLLKIVEDFFKLNNLKYEKIFLHKKPESTHIFRFLSDIPELRYYQKEIVELCLEKHRGIVESATGTGKTLIISSLVKRLSLDTLIIVPSTNILYQFHDNLLRLFGKKMVGIIGDGKKELDCKITVSTIQSLKNVPDFFWNKINVVIIDEFHHASSESFQELNKNQFQNIYYRFGFTGTNFRNDGTDLALKGVLSDIIYQYSSVKAINDGFLCKPVFILKNFDHKNGFDICQVNSKDISNSTGDLKKSAKLKYSKKEYDDCIVNNNEYNQDIAYIANKLYDEGKSIIIFVRQIEHGENLLKLIPRASLMTGDNKSRINDDLLTQFNSGAIRCLIGTSVIGEGVDTVRASVGIMASSGGADSEVIQKIGRILRPHESKQFAILYDYIHNNTRWQIKQSRTREKIYKSYQSDMIYL